ncbi:auxin efflux carrier [Klebsiella pneumoniae]|uniref:Auxin efflux carrier n=1 Tax=Klebsiella pneumoniae TaxID=573 RepID=A0A378F462_KLEPN|nr:auxin efflux carrier [Klebsiella pneumoniae]
MILSARKLQLNALIATSTIVKLLVQPFIAWGLVMLLGLHGSIAITAILMIALAAGFFGVVFGNRFGVQSPDAEAVLLLSSVLCILSLPLFISLTQDCKPCQQRRVPMHLVWLNHASALEDIAEPWVLSSGEPRCRWW